MPGLQGGRRLGSLERRRPRAISRRGLATASYEVNPRAVARAKGLIKSRQYVVRSNWGDVQPGAADEDAFLENHSWDEYAEWHLGLTSGARDETKGRYAFVFGDLRRVHRSGLIACVYRASEWEHKEVELAAHDLLQLLDTTRQRHPIRKRRSGSEPAGTAAEPTG